MPPEAIAKYMDKDYKDVVENAAYHTLMYLRERLSLDNEFIKGWKDALIAGIEVYYVGVQNAEPYMERVNPIYFAYDQSPDLEFIEDGMWCCRRMRLPYTEIYDRYFDKLTEKDLNKLEEMMTGRPANDMGEKDPVDNFNKINMHIYDNPVYDQKTRYNINVWHCCWKSFKKIYYVTMLDEEGNPQIEIVDEYYKKTGLELSVEPDWIVEVWEGYRAGSDLYFGIQPVEYQHVSIDNPNSQKLPYTGAVYSNTNSKPRSLVSILKPLQYMYIVLWYRLELAIARDKGKVVNMDITQIPKSMNITPDRWMHYLSSVGVNFINPYEEGWCFAPGTKVMTIDGVRNIEDIRKGDLILTPTKNVLGNAYQKADRLFAGTDEMYKIIPSVGCEEQTVTADHIIRYRYRINGKSEAEVRYDKAKDLMLKFKQNPYYKERCYLERIDELPHGIRYEGLDPYILGLWLGDGTKGTPEFESMDPEVIQYLEEYALTHNLRCSYRYKNDSKSMTIRLSSINNKKRGQCGKNSLVEDLRALGVYNNKHIPEDFLNYQIETRLQLLAGLIDTDGSVYHGKDNHGGYMEFTQCEERKDLVDMFVLIARSLGFKVGVKRVESKVTKIHHNKTVTIAQPFYKVRIFDGKYTIPTKIARKQFRWPAKRVFNSNYAHFNMEFVGRGQYYGFSLEGDKHEFVLGDMTIVHNCIPGREGGKPASFN